MRKSFGAKAICYPMPVFIIGTYNADGTPNAMGSSSMRGASTYSDFVAWKPALANLSGSLFPDKRPT